MAGYSRQLKRRYGTALLQLKNKGWWTLTGDEQETARALEGTGLTTFIEAPPAPPSIPAGDVHKYVAAAMNARCELTGLGRDFVQRHTQEQLLTGKFLMPGETPWFDEWPWKLAWPAVVSVITTLAVQGVKDGRWPWQPAPATQQAANR